MIQLYIFLKHMKQAWWNIGILDHDEVFQFLYEMVWNKHSRQEHVLGPTKIFVHKYAAVMIGLYKSYLVLASQTFRQARGGLARHARLGVVIWLHCNETGPDWPCKIFIEAFKLICGQMSHFPLILACGVIWSQAFLWQCGHYSTNAVKWHAV